MVSPISSPEAHGKRQKRTKTKSECLKPTEPSPGYTTRQACLLCDCHYLPSISQVATSSGEMAYNNGYPYYQGRLIPVRLCHETVEVNEF